MKMALGFDFEAKFPSLSNCPGILGVVISDLYLVYVNAPGLKYMHSTHIKEKVDTFFNIAYQVRKNYF
ncbi:hypothetical protein [Arenibacter sp. S6351L]|mgnify:CR=1 FL=1|uniref:hypothetical protein n=1 Tax=Arenibacter sp. S6351L TaxID=2926407 RepID=UPI001FF5F753|nr:hypothetical protein [Arenibacter sp. S6351L]MCK0135521.1 hypothetical protein [Arenibacter sp. S6351L]